MRSCWPPYYIEAKAIPYLFLDDSVSIEKETGGRVGKGWGQKHHTLVAANELKLVSSHIDCLVTQQVLFSLTKRKKHDSQGVCWKKNGILACEQIAFSKQKKIWLVRERSLDILIREWQPDNPCKGFVHISILKNRFYIRQIILQTF